MNIFYISADPRVCARELDDKRLVKMVLETAQMLSTVGALRGGDAPYRATHAHHPCVRWVAHNRSNYLWALRLFRAYCAEYSHRYGRRHKCQDHDEFFGLVAKQVPIGCGYPTERPNCTPFEGVELRLAYREHLLEKYRNQVNPPRWTGRPTPDWALEMERAA